MTENYYQKNDQNLIDYQLYQFQDLELRGPKSNYENNISYLGAAQTFGRYCLNPFPRILGDKLKIGTLNFGAGGIGPSYFIEQPLIIDSANKSKLVVVQFVSGRSVSNSVYESLGGAVVVRRIDNQKMRSENAIKDLIDGKDKRGLEKNFLKDLIAETRQNYVTEMIELLNAIKVPKVLFWFSVRTPQYQESYGKNLIHKLSEFVEKKSKNRIGILRSRSPLNSLFGEFPQLVNQEMIEQIKPHSDFYVECVTKVGLPQKLIDFNGNKKGVNRYYPSPEMHIKAAEMLYPVCQEILDTN
ncbi:MAG: hypothetical protein F6K40_28860 [Okeania sp. SIO3I5]|uniref:DUF6473 family protein n=1 Tax=Okeania sp. SIO3I5 TaxID=2607805 RepID=UPI0013B6F0EE|nr:DUF6473 family protein [Okeania sp. SIO3I5]NEQ40037.1 hypothetical protein [Okeania sp. SIO3I5]